MFLKFIYQYRYSAAAFLLFSAVFFGIFYIYDVSTEAVLYAGLLCLVMGAVMAAVRYIQFRKRYTLMQRIYENLPLMTDELPPPENSAEETLQEIIRRLSEISYENITELKNRQQDNADYFTVWIHQIKTPISAMQMILQSEDSETNRELLAELFRVEQYAEMALFYLRLDSCSNDLVIKKYSIDDIIRKAVHRYAPQFIRRRIKLVYAPSGGKAVTDEKWLLFIIEQLLSNAVKYTVKGSVTISFSGDILTVSDTGIGISQEDIPRIFEKGYTGLGGRTDRKSTGLGLYLCKKAADLLGHHISVTSEIGRGSSFSVDLSREKIDIE